MVLPSVPQLGPGPPGLALMGVTLRRNRGSSTLHGTAHGTAYGTAMARRPGGNRLAGRGGAGWAVEPARWQHRLAPSGHTALCRSVRRDAPE